jgi:hypothetical protein
MGKSGGVMITLDDFNIVKKSPPHDDCLWGKIIVKIRNNETGEIRDFYTDTIISDDEGFEWNDYWWSEGNASCDCNRGLFFEEANGKKYEEIDTECGDGKYSINIYSEKNNKLLYSEFNAEGL